MIDSIIKENYSFSLLNWEYSEKQDAYAQTLKLSPEAVTIKLSYQVLLGLHF